MLMLAAVLIALGGALAPVTDAPSAMAEASPAPAGSSQLITVNSASSSATTGTLSAWDRAADGSWTRVFGPVLAWVGTRGVGVAQEGAGRTPAGTFPLTEAFGRLDNPGTAMPYFKADRSDWWDENPSSPTYNLHVRQAGSPGGASENLYTTGASYDYAVNIGYNLDRVPGAGSGYFLHVTHNLPTAGCVAIDKATLAGIMRWLNPARSPYIVIRVGSAWSPNTTPFGSLVPGQAAGLTSGSPSYTFHGWSFDPDDPGRTTDVHVYDRRPDGSIVGIAVHAADPRPDVGAAHPAAGGSHGFNGSISLAGSGQHSVCAYGIDLSGGPNAMIGCRLVDVPGPTGALDAATNSAAGQLAVFGWAADPLAPGRPAPVHLYVSGPTGTVGYPIATGGSRSDVAAAVPWAGPNTGYSTTVPVSAAGRYQVCAYAINVNPPQTNPVVGCRTSTVTDVFGVLDIVNVASGTLQVAGWALNPNAAGDRVAIHVYDFGPTLRTFILTAETNRPDVAAAVPGFDGNHGFSAVLPAGAAGSHNVCAYAVNANGGSSANPVLGCRSVQV
jgi:L,D-peptidoglycan transpeptidase YkuD (ErfK/YbiS/YcfS/YnhG family)